MNTRRLSGRLGYRTFSYLTRSLKRTINETRKCSKSKTKSTGFKWKFRYFFSRFNFRAKVVQWSTRFPLQSRLSGRDFLLRILSSGTGADRESGSTGPAKTRIHPEGLDTRPTLRAETTVSIPNLKNNIFLMLLRHWDRSLEKSYYYLLI